MENDDDGKNYISQRHRDEFIASAACNLELVLSAGKMRKRRYIYSFIRFGYRRVACSCV